MHAECNRPAGELIHSGTSTHTSGFSPLLHTNKHTDDMFKWAKSQNPSLHGELCISHTSIYIIRSPIHRAGLRTEHNLLHCFSSLTIEQFCFFFLMPSFYTLHFDTKIFQTYTNTQGVWFFFLEHIYESDIQHSLEQHML